MDSYSYRPYNEKRDSSDTSSEQPIETEALIHEDGHGRPLPVHRRRRYCSTRGAIEAFLVLVALAESLYISYMKYSSTTLRPFGPPLPEKIVTFGNAAGFGPDLVYADPEMFMNATRNNEIHENWQALFPKGRGYVISPYSDGWEHAYPPLDIHGVVKDWQPAYILSVYHQLHCLSILASRMGTSREEFKKMEMNKVEHTSHCVEYLRQSILCSADTSMEGETGAWADAGWGQKHVCKDFDALTEFAEQRSAWDLSHSRHPNITGDPTDRGSYNLVPETGH